MEVDSLKMASGYSAVEQNKQNTNYSSKPVNTKDPIDVKEMQKIKIAKRKENDDTLSEAERYAERRENEVSKNLIAKAIEKANVRLAGSFRQLQFSIHEKTNRVMIKVVNSETHEVIREIPPESTLDTFAKVLELAGLMVDEKR